MMATKELIRLRSVAKRKKVEANLYSFDLPLFDYGLASVDYNHLERPIILLTRPPSTDGGVTKCRSYISFTIVASSFVNFFVSAAN